MKILLVIFFAVAVLLFATKAEAYTSRTNGYYKNNGTYVKPYYRTSPNSKKNDNYSYKGNYNPYTGKYGTKQ